jgi:hypothetical protein
VRLSALKLGDPPERWEALGFTVADRSVQLGEVTLELGGHRAGITAWSLPAVDGLDSFAASRRAAPVSHPNGASGLDHVVVVTPDFRRTAAALEAAGLPLRRIEGSMGFRRVGPAILELVQRRDAPPGPARFWGLVPIVEDLDALKKRLGDLLSDPKPAVQPGRRIATLSGAAGLSTSVAFMTP